MRKALIFGVAGNTGPYLANHLQNNDYKIIGAIRHNSQRNLYFINQFGLKEMVLEECDVTDANTVAEVIKKHKPDLIYNLAAMSHPAHSYHQAYSTINSNSIGTLNILEGIRNNSPESRFCNITSSDIFANTTVTPQDENSPMVPNSPYGASKILSQNLVDIYRQQYKLFAVNAICFGHESPRRSKDFVTGKIVRYFKKGDISSPLYIGNPLNIRDWGDVRCFVRGMRLMLEIDSPENFVFGTGRSTTVMDFINKTVDACQYLFDREINLAWTISQKECCATETHSMKHVVESKAEFWRNTEEYTLVANTTKAQKMLNWIHDIPLEDTIKWMLLDVVS